MHISNNYLRLAPVVYQLADYFGMKAAREFPVGSDPDRLLDANEWMLVTQNDHFLQVTPPDPPHFGDDDQIVPLWTDQYSNLFQILVPVSAKPVSEWFRDCWEKITPERWHSSNPDPSS